MICRPFVTCCRLLSHSQLLSISSNILIIISIVILISCSTTATADRPPPGVQCKRPQPFDRLLLALQWPPGVCYKNLHKTCIVNTDTFLIHGAWPSNGNGGGPEFCCSDRFRREEISQIQTQLSDKWKTIFQGAGNDESFWRHEWNKHGTCASASSPELKGLGNYFKETLRIYDRAPIKDWLKEAGIIPATESGRRFYSIAAMHEAIERHTNKRVYLECKRLPRKVSPFPILTGVQLCLNPQSLEFIDCQSKDDIDCGSGNLLFLSSGTTRIDSWFGMPALVLLVTAAAAVAHAKQPHF